MTHTPAPWRVDAHNNIMHHDKMVAFPCISGGQDQTANAHLIAAAPNLLLALLAMRDEFRALDLPYGSKAYNMATTAINKATGDQP